MATKIVKTPKTSKVAQSKISVQNQHPTKKAAAKPPLLFLHGFRGSHHGLAEVAALFPDYQVYNPDLPPAAGLTLPVYDANHYTKFIADYIKKHRLKQPILIGHSLGSILAAATAAQYPELVNHKLILLAPISTKPAKFFASLTPLTTVLPPRLVDYITTVYLFAPKDKQLFKKSIHLTHQCSGTYTSQKNTFQAAKFSAAHSINDFDISNNHVLIIAGAKERLIPIKKTQALAHNLPQAKLVVLKNTGHLLNYEKPEAVADTIRTFLNT